MSCFDGSAGEGMVVWIRFSGKSRSWGRSKADATGLAPQQTAPSPQSNRALCARSGGFGSLAQTAVVKSRSGGFGYKKREVAGPLLPGFPFAFCSALIEIGR